MVEYFLSTMLQKQHHGNGHPQSAFVRDHRFSYPRLTENRGTSYANRIFDFLETRIFRKVTIFVTYR